MPEQPAEFLQGNAVSPPVTGKPSGSTGDGENVLKNYISVIIQRIYVVIAILVLVVGGATAYSFLKTPIYRATARLLIEPASINVAPIQDVYDPTASAGRDFRGRRDFLETQMELIRSRHILEQAFAQLGFASMPEYQDNPNPIESFRKRVSVELNPNTYLVDISFDWKDPKLAAQVANFISRYYVQDAIRRRGGLSGGALEKLKVELGQMKQARNRATQDLLDYKEKHHLINLEDAQKLLIDSITQLTEGLVTAEEDEAMARAAVQSIETWQAAGGKLDYVPEASESNTLSLFKLERMRAQAKMIESMVDFGPRHRRVEAQRDVIGKMNQAISAELTGSLERAKVELERAIIRTKMIQAKLDARKADIIDLDKVAGQYRLLNDTLHAAEAAYRLVLKRINEIQIVESTSKDSSGGLVQVIVRATPPVLPAYPRKMLNIVVALMAGLILGIGAALLLDYMDSSVKTKEQVQALLGDRPILGFIPKLKTDERETIAIEDGRSLVAEGFQSMRTSLGLSIMGRNQRCFMVTSAQPGEGKTMTALNLAVAFAREGKSVLLMELDLRRPRLARAMGFQPRENGLSNVLVGASELKDVVHTIPDLPNLHVALSGAIPPSPPELLSSTRFRQVLKDALQTYDRVILDTPPVLNVADAAIIAGIGIPMILVVRAFKTDRSEVAAAVNQILTVQGTIVGGIMNAVDMPAKGYGYAGYYYYQYQYGEGGSSSRGSGAKKGRSGRSRQDKPQA